MVSAFNAETTAITSEMVIIDGPFLREGVATVVFACCALGDELA